MTKKELEKLVESLIKEQVETSRTENLEAMRKTLMRYYSNSEMLFEQHTFLRQFQRAIREAEEAIINQIAAIEYRQSKQS